MAIKSNRFFTLILACGLGGCITDPADLPVGEQGPEGPQGPQGEPGPAGADGNVGPQGPAGPAGPAGQDGAPGPQGPKGESGEVGEQGPQGPVGPAGEGCEITLQDNWALIVCDSTSQAIPVCTIEDNVLTCGDDSTSIEVGDGPDCSPVNNGDGTYTFVCDSGEQVTWTDGADGVDGQDGPQGPQGPKGDQGATGPAGPQGPQGPAGDGCTLLENADGEYALSCMSGEVTARWSDGQDGAPGPQGPQGEQGPAGPTGPAGPAGEQGPQGEVGPMGPAGPQGLTGPAGPQGPRGNTGATGSAGLNSLIRQTVVGPNVEAGCPDGGLRIDSGIDVNRNGVLNDNEVNQSNCIPFPATTGTNETQYRVTACYDVDDLHARFGSSGASLRLSVAWYDEDDGSSYGQQPNSTSLALPLAGETICPSATLPPGKTPSFVDIGIWDSATNWWQGLYAERFVAPLSIDVELIGVEQWSCAVPGYTGEQDVGYGYAVCLEP